MSEDIKIISVRRAEDDSGWHVRFGIGDIEYPPVWIATEGYLDRELLKNALAEKTGFKRPRRIFYLHTDIHLTNITADVSPDPKSEGVPPPPPRFAEAIFAWFAPSKTLHAQLGDMQELYDSNVARFGRTRADRLYWTQVVRAVGPGLWRLVKRWGVVAFLIDYGRSKIGW
jgi:hypothetical protein